MHYDRSLYDIYDVRHYVDPSAIQELSGKSSRRLGSKIKAGRLAVGLPRYDLQTAVDPQTAVVPRRQSELVIGFALVRDVVHHIKGVPHRIASHANIRLHHGGVRCLIDHDEDEVCASTLAGNLHVEATDIGLFVSMFPDDSQAGRRLLNELHVGGVKGLSAGSYEETRVEHDWLYGNVVVATEIVVDEVTFAIAFDPCNYTATGGLLTHVAEPGWGRSCPSDRSAIARAERSLKEIAWKHCSSALQPC